MMRSGYGQSPSGENVGSSSGYGRTTVGTAGLGLTLIGVAAVVGSFTLLDWLDVGGQQVGFGELHEAATATTSTDAPLATIYFSWLGWVGVAAIALVGLVANLPSAGSSASRVIGVLLGIALAVVTVFAIVLGRDLGMYFSAARAGWYVAIAGFVVAGIGSAQGPRRT